MESAASRILLVEDDEMVQLLVSHGVKSDECELHAVGTVQGARDALASQDFDAVILDLFLPDGDGRQLLIEIRDRPGWANVPIVVLSGHAGRDAKLECFRQGADEFFEKPFDPEVLGAAVQRQLERARATGGHGRIDPATGLPDRATLIEGFDDALARCREEGGPLTLAVVEIDVDPAAASATDGLLRSLADALTASAGPGALVGRWDGVRFVVAFPAAALEGAREALEAARGALGDAFPTLSAALLDASGAASLRSAVARAESDLLCRATKGRIEVVADVRPRGPNPRIFMVEDDETTAALVRHRLERECMDVEHVARGADALDVIERGAGAFDLVLLDVKLPGLGGLELLEELRRREGWKSLPVVMLTGMGREADVVRAFELGANDYVLKPFSPIELLARIQRLLRTGG